MLAVDSGGGLTRKRPLFLGGGSGSVSDLLQIKARGAQENLWPKFILESAPLRATSSGLSYCTPRANRKLLKLQRQ